MQRPSRTRNDALWDGAAIGRKVMPWIVLFDNTDYTGSRARLDEATPNLGPVNMNKITSAAIVLSGIWNVYSGLEYEGAAWTLSDNGGFAQNGTFPTYSNTFQNDTIQSAQPNPECQTVDPPFMILLCQNTNFTGQSSRLTEPTTDLGDLPIKYTTSALIVGSGAWNLYPDINYGGTAYPVSATGGPNNDGIYPTYEGYFPNDAIKSLKPA